MGEELDWPPPSGPVRWQRLAVSLALGCTAVVAVGGVRLATASPSHPSLPIAASTPGAHAAGPNPAATTRISPSVPASPTVPSTTAPTAGSSPALVLQRVLAAAQQQRTVHVVSQVRRGRRSETFVDDAGPDGGIQRITGVDGRQAVIKVIGPDTYLRAPLPMLRTFFGIPRDIASQDRHRWIHFTAGDPAYRAISADIIFAATLRDLHLQPALTLLSPRARHGQLEYAVAGGFPRAFGPHVRGRLWVNVSTGLPSDLTSVRGGASARATYSHWGESLKNVAPPTSVSIDDLILAARGHSSTT